MQFSPDYWLGDSLIEPEKCCDPFSPLCIFNLPLSKWRFGWLVWTNQISWALVNCCQHPLSICFNRKQLWIILSLFVRMQYQLMLLFSHKFCDIHCETPVSSLESWVIQCFSFVHVRWCWLTCVCTIKSLYLVESFISSYDLSHFLNSFALLNCPVPSVIHESPMALMWVSRSEAESSRD